MLRIPLIILLLAGAVLSSALAQTEIVNAPVSGPPPLPAPPGSVEPPAIVPAPAPEAEPPAKDTAPTPAPEENPYRSLLYAPEDMKKIYEAERIYRVNLEKARELARLKGMKVTPAVLAQMQKPEEQARTVDHPQFFLSLIAFHTEKDWAVKVNGAEYTAENPTVGELSVISVNKTNVRFSWKPIVFPIYSERSSPDVTKNIVWVNRDDQRVEFTLAVNQSFSGYSMRIVEGYLPPVRQEQFTTAVSVDAESSVQVNEPGR